MSPSFFFRVPEKRPRTVCRCQPIALASSSTVAPSVRYSIAITASCFDGRFVFGPLVRVRQSLDGRPQLIDQHIAVADLFPLLDTGQRIPQRQQSLAAERGGVQFFL